MLLNTVILAILVLAVFFIAKAESANIRKWIYSDRTEFKKNLLVTFDFWKNVAKKPIRIVALAVVLICQGSLLGMFIAIAILLIVSYYLAKRNILDRINWENNDTQKTTTALSIALALCWLIDKFALLRVLYSMVVIGCLIVVGLVVIYIVFVADKDKSSEENKNSVVNPSTIVEENDEDSDSEGEDSSSDADE